MLVCTCSAHILTQLVGWLGCLQALDPARRLDKQVQEQLEEQEEREEQELLVPAAATGIEAAAVGAVAKLVSLYGG